MAQYHMAKAMEASASPRQSEDLRRWLLVEDAVLFYHASATAGTETLRDLKEEYGRKGEHYKAAKACFSLFGLSTTDSPQSQSTLLKSALALLDQEGSSRTRESLQLEWEMLGKYSWLAAITEPEEIPGIEARQVELKESPSVKHDPMVLYNMVRECICHSFIGVQNKAPMPPYTRPRPRPRSYLPLSTTGHGADVP